MDSDATLFFALLLILYLLFRDLQPRAPLPAHVPQGGVPSDQEARHFEDRESNAPHPDPSFMQVDEEVANSMPMRDTHRATFEGRQVAPEEGIFPGPTAGSSTPMGNLRDQPNVIGASASQSNVLGNPPHTVHPSDTTISVSTLSLSFVNKFAGLRVNTTYSFLESSRSMSHDCTPPSSPLSTPPSSPFYSSSMSSFQTPVASREYSGASSNSVDFSLYKKKIRVLTKTKSPKKSQTKVAGKSVAREPAVDVTTTTWFYKTLAEPRLLDTPPDLRGHPDGLALGDVYFDGAKDQYQLWLWCLDDVGAPHWKKIPFSYEREDGKHLIVTRKIHFLSWVTTKYYKGVSSDDPFSVSMDVDED